MKGGYEPVPPLDDRIKHAMRLVGGPYRIWSNIDHGEGTGEAYSFVKRDFIVAWKLAPAVGTVAALEAVSDAKLLGELKALAHGRTDT
jgi:hypothetical protein